MCVCLCADADLLGLTCCCLFVYFFDERSLPLLRERSLSRSVSCAFGVNASVVVVAATTDAVVAAVAADVVWCSVCLFICLSIKREKEYV